MEELTKEEMILVVNLLSQITVRVSDAPKVIEIIEKLKKLCK